MKIYSLASALIAIAIFGNSYSGHAQGMAVNTTGTAANSSAMLDVSSTTKGMLVPRMTAAQEAAISSPSTGLMVYQTDGTAGFYYYNGTAWSAVGGGGSIGYNYTVITSNTTAAAGVAYFFGADNIRLTMPSSPAVGATVKFVCPTIYSNDKLNMGVKTGFDNVSFTVYAATTDYVISVAIPYVYTLVYDGTEWMMTTSF